MAKKKREEAAKFPIEATCNGCGAFFGCPGTKGMVMKCGCGKILTWNDNRRLKSYSPFTPVEFILMKKEIEQNMSAMGSNLNAMAKTQAR